MEDIRLIQELCKKYCSYYKPSKDEEIACRGFIVAEKLIEKGKKINFDDYDLSMQSDQLVSSTVKDLVNNLCLSCSFYENDCDFAESKKGAQPCGGFIFLGYLIDNDVINIDDIINIK